MPEPLKFQDTREREEWLRAYLAIVTSPNPVLRSEGSRFFADEFADHALRHLRKRAAPDTLNVRIANEATHETESSADLTAGEVLDVILDAAFDDAVSAVAGSLERIVARVDALPEDERVYTAIREAVPS